MSSDEKDEIIAKQANRIALMEGVAEDMEIAQRALIARLGGKVSLSQKEILDAEGVMAYWSRNDDGSLVIEISDVV